MQMDQSHKLMGDAVNRLAQQLEAGDSAQLQAYLKAMSRFRRYSVGNVLLILAQRPDATHVAGFKAWRAMGRHIRRGQHGIVITAPCVRRHKLKENPAGTEDDEEVYAFRQAYVFDVSQTEGRALPQPPRADGDPGQYLVKLRGFVASRGIALDYAAELGSAEGVSGGGVIAIRQGLAAAEEFSTLVHELAHELIHHAPDATRDKTVVETEAEAVAFVVCQMVGLDSVVASSDYIRLYRGSKDTLLASLERIRSTASVIVDGIVDSGEAQERAVLAPAPDARVPVNADSSGGDESWQDCA